MTFTMTTNRKIHTLQHLTIAEMGKLNIFILFSGRGTFNRFNSPVFGLVASVLFGGVATAEFSLTRVASGWLNCCSWSVNLLREETGLGEVAEDPTSEGCSPSDEWWLSLQTRSRSNFSLRQARIYRAEIPSSSLLRINRFGKRFFYKLGCSPCHLRQTCYITVTRLAFLFAWKYNWMLYVKGRVGDLFIFLLNGHSVCEQVTWPRHIHATGVEGCLFHIEIIWSKTIFSSSSS